MTKKEGHYIILRLSSDGGNGESIAPYKSGSTGYVENAVIHTDDGLEGIAEKIRHDIAKKHGDKVRNAANNLRKKAKLASEKKACA